MWKVLFPHLVVPEPKYSLPLAESESALWGPYIQKSEGA
jgi:hypothetical protein